MNQASGALDRASWHRLRLLIVATLILLTVQGWFGDTVNIFFIPTAPPTVEQSATGVLQAVEGIGPTLVIHSFVGLAILGLAVIVLAFSIKSNRETSRSPPYSDLPWWSPLLSAESFLSYLGSAMGVIRLRWVEASSEPTRFISSSSISQSSPKVFHELCLGGPDSPYALPQNLADLRKVNDPGSISLSSDASHAGYIQRGNSLFQNAIYVIHDRLGASRKVTEYGRVVILGRIWWR